MIIDDLRLEIALRCELWDGEYRDSALKIDFDLFQGLLNIRDNKDTNSIQFCRWVTDVLMMVSKNIVLFLNFVEHPR